MYKDKDFFSYFWGSGAMVFLLIESGEFLPLHH